MPESLRSQPEVPSIADVPSRLESRYNFEQESDWRRLCIERDAKVAALQDRDRWKRKGRIYGALAILMTAIAALEFLIFKK